MSRKTTILDINYKCLKPKTRLNTNSEFFWFSQLKNNIELQLSKLEFNVKNKSNLIQKIIVHRQVRKNYN